MSAICDEIKDLKKDLELLKSEGVKVLIDETVLSRLERVEELLRWHGLDDKNL